MTESRALRAARAEAAAARTRDRQARAAWETASTAERVAHREVMAAAVAASEADARVEALLRAGDVAADAEAAAWEGRGITAGGWGPGATERDPADAWAEHVGPYGRGGGGPYS